MKVVQYLIVGIVLVAAGSHIKNTVSHSLDNPIVNEIERKGDAFEKRFVNQ